MKSNEVQKSLRVTGLVLPLCNLPQKEPSLVDDASDASGLNYRFGRSPGGQLGHQEVLVTRRETTKGEQHLPTDRESPERTQ